MKWAIRENRCTNRIHTSKPAVAGRQTGFNLSETPDGGLAASAVGWTGGLADDLWRVHVRPRSVPAVESPAGAPGTEHPAPTVEAGQDSGPDGGMWSYYAVSGTRLKVRIMAGVPGEAEYDSVTGELTRWLLWLGISTVAASTVC
jgi:hypothetical protein